LIGRLRRRRTTLVCAVLALASVVLAIYEADGCEKG
jgi:hypothetical protein